MTDVNRNYLDDVPVSMGDLRMILRVVEIAHNSNLAIDLNESYRSMNAQERISPLTSELARAQARVEGYLEEGRRLLEEQVEQVKVTNVPE